MQSIIKRISYLDIIFASIILFKISFFYIFTDIKNGGIMIGIITLAIIVIAFYSNIINNQPTKWKSFIIIYSIISIIMFIDSMYYSYFNQLISINQIFQVKKLLAVKKSLKFMSVPLSTLLIIDIPFVIWYFKRLKQKIKVVDENYKRLIFYKKVTVTMLFLTITILVINPFDADTVKAINHNEVITYHIYDFYTNIVGDLDNKIKTEEDAVKVFNSNKSEQNGEKEYYGIGKDRNLIVIQVESLQNFALNKFYEGQELTPFLNKLMDDGTIYFENYYQSIGKGNTSDAEFATLNSLYPNIEGSCYERYTDNTFYGLPWIMRENGYYTTAYHGYDGDFWNREKAYPFQGFQDFKSAEDFQISTHIAFGMADEEMFAQSIEYIKEMPKPFFSFLVTLSCHHPYEVPEEYAEIQLKEEDVDTTFGNYMQAVNYSDRSIEGFIEGLKENGLYEDSIIVLYGDHYGLNSRIDDINSRMTEYLGYPYDFDEMLNIPLMIHIPGEEASSVKTITGGQVDFLPTIANIMGVEIKNPYIIGKDLLNSENGFSAFVTFMLRGSFISNGVMFEYSEDGIYETSRAWDVKSLKERSVEGFENEHSKAKNYLDASKYILDNDLIQRRTYDN